MAQQIPINLEQLHSIVTTAEIKNLTSDLAFKKDLPIILCELDSDRLVFEVPERSCAERHHLLIGLSVRTQTTTGSVFKQVSLTGRVDESESCGSGRERIRVTLMQCEQKAWEEFQDVFVQRQKNIDAFMDVTRGVGPVKFVGEAAKKVQQAEALNKYLGLKKVLIVDPSLVASQELANGLKELGLLGANISFARSLPVAVEMMGKQRPDIVFAEYNLGNTSGLELLQNQRANCRDLDETIFILVTSNSSQAAVARAAEQDVDAFVIKPFNLANLKKTIVHTAMLKLNPPAYMAEIRAGERSLSGGDLQNAEFHFQDALKLDEKPALACYYLGRLEMEKKRLHVASQYFKDGLQFNRIHFKCMEGRYEVAMLQEEFQEAYDLVNRISHYFPVNSKRLSDMLRLAIRNRRFQDVERYFALFCQLSDRNQRLVDHISAALIVCGRYYLRTKNKIRGMELLEKAAVTGLQKQKFFYEIIQTLVDYRMATEARVFFDKYSSGLNVTPEYMLFDFQVDSLIDDPYTIQMKTRDLVKQGILPARTYQCAIRRLREEGFDDQARELAVEAKNSLLTAQSRAA